MRAYERTGANEKQLVRDLVRTKRHDEAERLLEILHFFPGTTVVSERNHPDVQGIAGTSRSSQGVLDGNARPGRSETTVRDVPHSRQDDLFTAKVSGAMTEEIEGQTSVLRPHTSKHTALVLIAQFPRTAIEAERASHKRGLWKRVSDLKNAGLIEAIGERVDPETNRPGVIWQITELGERVLSELNAGRDVRL